MVKYLNCKNPFLNKILKKTREREISGEEQVF